ncbi:MAG: hypothetical protein ACREI9_09165 [Nitrospiraceae bacterium]
MATWAQTATALAADLMAGNEDPAATPRTCWVALAALPAAAWAGRILLRADVGYFAGQPARAALMAGVGFAIGAKCIGPLWRIWPVCPSPSGPTRSTWTARRSRWPTTARTGGLRPPGY